ncbi:MAG: hypothetical protein WC371_00205 [Parachlamydiales bacterium]|jgi:hypothetical protein
MKHEFILKPNNWIGEGTITLNMVEEELSFYTKWQVQGSDFAGKIASSQELQIAGIAENMRNELTFYDFNDKRFSVEMENSNIGRVSGSGVYDEKLIAWEFRSKELNFEGFESHYLQPDGSYLMHVEYVTSDQFRTQIEGRLWLPPQTKGE